MSICMLFVVSIAVRYPSFPVRDLGAKNITDAMPPKIHEQNLRDMSEMKERKCQKRKRI